MNTQDVILSLPEPLFLRFQQMARATRQPLTDLLVRAVEVGGPPDWAEAPARFQADLAALDRVDDDGLWRVARSRSSQASVVRLQELLEQRAETGLTPDEQNELDRLTEEADRLMLRKAHAAALLRWRGHAIPPAEKL
jgi:hypothetical protein